LPLIDPSDDVDVRRAVLGAFGPFDLWDADDLAGRLTLPRSAVTRAISELVRDGQLREHPDGFAVVGAEIA
jgi:DNA-binding IclR family transcriptional regulator